MLSCLASGVAVEKSEATLILDPFCLCLVFFLWALIVIHIFMLILLQWVVKWVLSFWKIQTMLLHGEIISLIIPSPPFSLFSLSGTDIFSCWISQTDPLSYLFHSYFPFPCYFTYLSQWLFQLLSSLFTPLKFHHCLTYPNSQLLGKYSIKHHHLSYQQLSQKLCSVLPGPTVTSKLPITSPIFTSNIKFPPS